MTEEKKYKITFKNRTVTWVDQEFMNDLRDLILFDHEKGTLSIKMPLVITGKKEDIIFKVINLNEIVLIE